MKTILNLLAGLTVVCASTAAHAIPSSYGSATHNSPHWQTLADPANNDNYGVTWSVDNGLTWGRDDVTVGQTLQFRFNMFKPNVGTHYADHVAAWVDWGQDGAFDHTADQIVYGEHVIATAKGQVNTAVESALGTWRTPDTPNITFYSSAFAVDDSHVGDLWLRAQVTCSHSLTKAAGVRNHWDAQWHPNYTGDYQNLFGPTGHYYQGETEEWKITVTSVPEPSTIALLALGMLGLVVTRKRMA